jgi:hypothetical protein
MSVTVNVVLPEGALSVAPGRSESPAQRLRPRRRCGATGLGEWVLDGDAFDGSAVLQIF